jgi:acetyltransferase-like isoleucine patch superfamily enzyme
VALYGPKRVALYHRNIHFGDYDYSPVHFGVLHAHIKYVLYCHFLFHHDIDKARYHSFVHPLSYFPKSSTYGKGFYIGQLSAVSSFSNFGFGVTIKKSCSIGHHCDFGDFVTINPGSVIAGYSKIGDGTEIGTGSIISNNITVGKHCLIGAGSVVTKDIPDGVIAYGNPCKVIRENERWQKAEKLTKQY